MDAGWDAGKVEEVIGPVKSRWPGSQKATSQTRITSFAVAIPKSDTRMR